MGDDYIRERLEEFDRLSLWVPFALGKRFPVGAAVVLPRDLGGGVGRVDSYRANQPGVVVVREDRGALEPRTHFVPGLDLLRANPRPRGGL